MTHKLMHEHVGKHAKMQKKQIEGKHAKRQASKRCQTGASKHVMKQKMGCPRRTNVGLDWVCKEANRRKAC